MFEGLAKLYRKRHNTSGATIKNIAQRYDMTKELDTKQAADRWGISEVYIRRLVREGRIEGRKVRRDWLIGSKSLEAYMKGNRKRGRKSSS